MKKLFTILLVILISFSYLSAQDSEIRGNLTVKGTVTADEIKKGVDTVATQGDLDNFTVGMNKTTDVVHGDSIWVIHGDSAMFKVVDIEALADTNDIIAGGEPLYISDSTRLMNNVTGIFNILDYGAISDDGLNDADNIRAAVTASQAYMTSYFGNGTVYIPPGVWTLTDSVVLGNYVHIVADRNAYFYMPTAYYGSVYYTYDSSIVGCEVSGGTYYSDGHNYKFLNVIDTVDANSYMMGCVFRDLTIRGANTGLRVDVQNSGWFNDNYFENVLISDCINGMHMTDDGTSSGIEGNEFNFLRFQTTSINLYAIKDFGGDRNLFLNCFIWDVTDGVGATFSAASRFNRWIGGYLSATGFSDASTQNNFFETNNDDFTGNIASRMRLYDTYGYRDSINKLTIMASTATGPTAAPAGFIGIKIGSYASEKYSSQDDWAGRVLVGNSADADYGSFMKLQTHPTTTGTTYTDALILAPNGEATFANSITTTASDTTVTAVLGKIVYKTSDNHFYGCRATSGHKWYQLDN